MQGQKDAVANGIAREIGRPSGQVEAAIRLLDEGATVPFIARYRKEATGNLDDGHLRRIAERLVYLRELEERREAVFKSIDAQGKMTDGLAASIAAAATKADLEDVYLPYRQKRRTRAEIARERGLGPLAEALLASPAADPQAAAAGYVGPEVPDAKAALEGARDILSETFAENAKTVRKVRDHMKSSGTLRARVVEGKETEGAKYSDYFDHSEAWAKAPGHRVLAMMRARNEGVLTLDVELPEAGQGVPERIVMEDNGIRAGSAWLEGVAKWTWRVKLSTRLGLDLMTEARERAEAEAIEVFARNLKDLLMAAPAGSRTTLGLDPGVRTGVKCAVVDGTGKLLETATVYPFAPRNDVSGALACLKSLMRKHAVGLVAIGNGTASRETDALAGEAIRQMEGAKPVKVIVSEAGASVYSASELAATELPGVDVTLRGAVSIARRLQDPLAELVKIEPKSIGVGQYQHDVDQHRLGKALDAAVEDAVNAVGVDLNTASPALLSRVSGLGASLAGAVVAHRDANGPFLTRKALLDVPRLGARAFEQCAGFLRILDGAQPLDASAVHPEAYPVAERIVSASGKPLKALMGDREALKRLNPAAFADGRFGLPTVKDILAELEKPGRDPRPSFKTASLADGVHEISDLKPGMRLEGTVTNVAAFGAFVDVGVHQDGLVHVSEMADRFVRNPAEVVKAGDIVKVTVMEVDLARKRIALSMKSAPQAREGSGGQKAPSGAKPRPADARNASTGGLGEALIAAMKERGR